jgi:hypothetical protein
LIPSPLGEIKNYQLPLKKPLFWGILLIYVNYRYG